MVSSNLPFFCSICDYTTSRRSNWSRHICSKKHLKNEQKTSSADEALPTIEDFNNLLDELETLKSEKASQKPSISQKNTEISEKKRRNR